MANVVSLNVHVLQLCKIEALSLCYNSSHLKALNRPRQIMTAKALILGIIADRVPQTKVDGETKKLDRQTAYSILT